MRSRGRTLCEGIRKAKGCAEERSVEQREWTLAEGDRRAEADSRQTVLRTSTAEPSSEPRGGAGFGRESLLRAGEMASDQSMCATLGSASAP